MSAPPIASPPLVSPEPPGALAPVLAAWDETAILRGIRVQLDESLQAGLGPPGQALRVTLPGERRSSPSPACRRRARSSS